MKNIKDNQSFNEGISTALDILRQHYFAGNLLGCDTIISQIEKRKRVCEPENGVFPIRKIENVKDIFVETVDVLQMI